MVVEQTAKIVRERHLGGSDAGLSDEDLLKKMFGEIPNTRLGRAADTPPPLSPGDNTKK